MRTRSRLRSLEPLLVVADVARSIEFYTVQLGFGPPTVHGEPPTFAMLARDGYGLMLRRADGGRPPRPHGPSGTWDLYLELSDLAAEFTQLERCGVVLDRGPTDAPYGMREAELLDPDGHRICLAQDILPGSWPDTVFYEGALDLGPRRLRLVLHLAREDGAAVGCLDSPDQGAQRLPIDHILRDGASLSFRMTALGAAFEGTFDADEHVLAGRWSQGGRTWRLVLRRIEGPPGPS